MAIFVQTMNIVTIFIQTTSNVPPRRQHSREHHLHMGQERGLRGGAAAAPAAPAALAALIRMFVSVPLDACVERQRDGLTIHAKKWFLGAGFLGAPPISLRD